MKKHNFFAGPSVLPDEVYQKSAEAVIDFEQTGVSILSISHREKKFIEVVDHTKALVKELLNIGDDYDVLFLQGGASTQFFMAPMGYLADNELAAYIDTGVWSKKAIKEAQRFGKVDVIASSKDKNYNYIPKDFIVPKDAKYLHITSNNTIFGTQFQQFPDAPIKMIGDMSSDIFSRPFDATKFSLIYAGAQKNLGPAGVTLVIIEKAFMTQKVRELPTMLDYSVHSENNSMANTPTCFGIYVSMLTLEWIKRNGGLAGMEKRNNAKAQLLYDEIDRNTLFEGTAAINDRSKMNVCFLLKDESLMQDFLSRATEANCVGLKGHRSVGGFRASNYNALDISSVQVLVDVMRDFELQHGK